MVKTLQCFVESSFSIKLTRYAIKTDNVLASLSPLLKVFNVSITNILKLRP